MSSGVGVNQECLEQFQALKLGKKFKYIIYKLKPTSSEDNTEIVVEKTSESKDYDEFVEQLPEAEARYAIYDFEYEKGDGIRNKICFIAWTPDNCKIRAKMLYASSKDAIRKSLVGISAEIQATDSSEISYDAVLAKVGRGA